MDDSPSPDGAQPEPTADPTPELLNKLELDLSNLRQLEDGSVTPTIAEIEKTIVQMRSEAVALARLRSRRP